MSSKIPALVFICFLISQAINAQEKMLSSLSILKSTNYVVVPASAAGPMPPVKDFSDKFPPAGNQCLTGSCVSFACTYSLLSYLTKKELNQPYIYTNAQGLVKESVFSPYYSFYFNKDNNTCSKSVSSIYMTLMFLKDKGSVTLDKFNPPPCTPDNCNIEPDKTLLPQAKIKNFGWIYSKLYNPTLQASGLIKRFLFMDIPCVVIMDVSDDFDGQRNKPANYVYNTSYNKGSSYHAMVCCGYDETKKALKFINSFDKEWGNNGMIWISESVVNKHIEEAYVANVHQSLVKEGQYFVHTSTQKAMMDTTSLNQVFRVKENELTPTGDVKIAIEKLPNNLIKYTFIERDKDGIDYISSKISSDKTDVILNNVIYQISVKGASLKMFDKNFKLDIREVGITLNNASEEKEIKPNVE